MPGGGEDMTACFGAVDVKTIPQRVFSCYPNRPQLAASVYCDHRVEKEGRGGYSREAWQGLPHWILHLLHDQEEKHQTRVGKMIPNAVNHSVYFFL